MTTATARSPGLPTELLLAIASYCSRPTLCSLALLNSTLSNAVTQVLYTGVEIRNLGSLKQFVRTLTDFGRAHLKNLPISLDIDLRHENLIIVFYIDTLLREAISHTPNLQNLVLLVAPSIIERVFQNIQCSLVLNQFTCCLSSGKELSCFLNSQHALEELVFSADEYLRPAPLNQDLLVNLKPQSLPSLRSVSANLVALSILIPGRPVNKASTGTWRLKSDNFAAFAEVLSRSTAQLDMVEISLFAGDVIPSLSNDDGLLPALRHCSVQPRRLTLNLSTYRYFYLKAMKYSALLEALRGLDLDGFTRMENFEIIQSSGPTSWATQDPPFVQEHSVFEAMKQSCPSMKTLNLLGLEIQ
ncbi:hypothetical protein FRC08_012326 [Ceratobasidium sp. 394]|nr:hypothetical protein FRC08_012326 [Ceratobasidium sp. 394]